MVAAGSLEEEGDHSGFPFVCLGLKNFSIRAVMPKPPTTLIVAQVTARKPRKLLSVPCPEPATTSEPTSEMPEMAFVADISGVCSSGGMRESTR